MLPCKFSQQTDGVKCVRCGHSEITHHPPERVHAECMAFPLSDEWGHWVALFLATVGLRKETWNWIRRRLGLIEPCNCDGREAWLNTLGGRAVTAWRRIKASGWAGSNSQVDRER